MGQTTLQETLHYEGHYAWFVLELQEREAPVTAAAKMPFQQVFWDNYVNHPQLKACSFAAQGVWPHMLKVCWEATPRGHFLSPITGKTPTLEEMATETGKPAEIIAPLLAELEANRVFSRTPEGVIFCRRMVNDEARRRAKKAKAGQGGDDGLTEQELHDRAVQAALDAVNADLTRKEKAAARQRNCRERKRAASGLEKMRAFDAMATAAALSDARAVTPESVTCHVTPPVTVTLQGPNVTRDSVTESVTRSEQDQQVRPLSRPNAHSMARDQNPESRISNQPEPPEGVTARSLATLTGGSLAEDGEGVKGLQDRIARTLIRSPSESEEAFAARCAGAAAGVGRSVHERRAEMQRWVQGSRRRAS